MKNAIQDHVNAQSDMIAFLRDEGARLGVALWPFARLGEFIDPELSDAHVVFEHGGLRITARQVRAAAKALKPIHQRIEL